MMRMDVPMPSRLRYGVRVFTNGPSGQTLIEYHRDHYGILTVGALLKEMQGGLEQIVPVNGSPISIEVSVGRYGL